MDDGVLSDVLGEVHITAAKGSTNIALVEIDQAPYLVRSFKEAFDSGEKPINMDASNIVWVDPPGISARPRSKDCLSLG